MMNKMYRSLWVPVLAVGLTPPMPLFAQTGANDALDQCARLQADAERLACYDGLTGDSNVAAPNPAVSDRPAEPDIVESDREQPAVVVRENADIEPAPAPQVTTVEVVSVRENLSGFAIFATRSNGTWVQTSAQAGRFPEPPFAARIEPGRFGSHFLRPVDGGTAVRVRQRN